MDNRLTDLRIGDSGACRPGHSQIPGPAGPRHPGRVHKRLL